MRLVRATLTVCQLCQAEYVKPLPDGWSFTARSYHAEDRKKHSQIGGFVTVHTADCRRKFKEIT